MGAGEVGDGGIDGGGCAVISLLLSVSTIVCVWIGDGVGGGVGSIKAISRLYCVADDDPLEDGDDDDDDRLSDVVHFSFMLLYVVEISSMCGGDGANAFVFIF